jgi:hypothetical protein
MSIQATQPLLLRYKWSDWTKDYWRDDWDYEHTADVPVAREIVLREEGTPAGRVYHVSYSAQLVSGRHARTVEAESFTSRETAFEFLLAQAQKYAPQNVSDAIHAELKAIWNHV